MKINHIKQEIYHKVASSQWLDCSVGRALDQYRRGHVLKSRSGLNLFQALISQLLTLCAKLQ